MRKYTSNQNTNSPLRMCRDMLYALCGRMQDEKCLIVPGKKQLKNPIAFSIILCLSRKSVGLFPDMEGKVLLYGNQGANFQFKQSSAGSCLWKSFPSQLEPRKQYTDTE